MRARGRPRTIQGGAAPGRARPVAAGPLTRVRAAWIALAVALGAAVGCALGPEQEPGCKVDADCDEGFVCKAGACFRTTTGHTPPEADGGDAAD